MNDELRELDYKEMGRRIRSRRDALSVTADYVLAGNLRKKDADGEAERVREEIMVTLQICDAGQLSDVRQVAWIFADRSRRKK